MLVRRAVCLWIQKHLGFSEPLEMGISFGSFGTSLLLVDPSSCPDPTVLYTVGCTISLLAQFEACGFHQKTNKY